MLTLTFKQTRFRAQLVKGSDYTPVLSMILIVFDNDKYDVKV